MASLLSGSMATSAENPLTGCREGIWPSAGWTTVFDRCLTRVERDHPHRSLLPASSSSTATDFLSFQMGWFSSNTPEPIEVSREARKHCWDSRDVYFKCLDNAGILKPGDEGKTTCASEKVAYGKNCAKSWVCCFPQAFLRKYPIEVTFLDRIL